MDWPLACLGSAKNIDRAYSAARSTHFSFSIGLLHPPRPEAVYPQVTEKPVLFLLSRSCYLAFLLYN